MAETHGLIQNDNQFALIVLIQLYVSTQRKIIFAPVTKNYQNVSSLPKINY